MPRVSVSTPPSKPALPDSVSGALTDASGKRTGVGLDPQTDGPLHEAEEKLADARAYDALHDCAHSEIAAGQCATLTSHRCARKSKGK